MVRPMNIPKTGVAVNQNGMVLLTVLVIMVVMTITGIAAITVTGLENRVAGFARTGEAASTAAESCLGTAANIIQQIYDIGSVPASLLNDATPAGPIPQTNQTILTQEIVGQLDNHTDDINTAPNTFIVVNGFTVRGDIDRLYARPKAGGALQSHAAFEGTGAGAASGGIDILYRIDCIATNTVTNTNSRITAIYACTVTGESCQKQL
jgi:Tfp pilus assembly protein PilX